MVEKVYIFGYGAIGKQIAKKISHICEVVIIDTEQTRIEKAQNDGFIKTYLTDITDDSQLAKITFEREKSSVICAMDEEAQNIFLVISIRAIYEDINIIAISDSLEMNHKLSMAGATKVLDIYKPSANRIYNILEKPYVLKVFDILFNPTSHISFKEYKIGLQNSFIGKQIDELNLKNQRLILIGVMDSKMDEHFTFTTHGHKHIIKAGDVLVCMGKDKDLENFGKIINEDNR